MTLAGRAPHRNTRRMIRARMRSGPVNRSILLSAVFAGAAYLSWPNGRYDDLRITVTAFSGLIATTFAGSAVSLLVRDYRLRRDLAISEGVSMDHGSARTATPAERAERGMDRHESGELLGLDEDGRPVWRPAKTPFALIEMPPGVGKTVSLVIGSILHRAMLGFSVVVPDVKTELAVMLAASLRALGFEVWCVNPAGRYAEITGDTILNPYQPLIDALYGEADDRRNAVKNAADYASLHYPSARDEKNPYFVFGSRRAMLLGNVSNALFDPANATPTALYALLADPVRFLERCAELQTFETTIPHDPVVEVLRLEARNLLHRAEKNEENFASFLEGATQRLLPFNPAGHLGHYGRDAIHNLQAIRERQIILFIMTPLSHMREFADFISLLNHNIIAACKAKPDGHPIHIVGEEALNYRFQDLVSDLETMRQLGVSADFYIQSFAGLERHYGKEAAAAIESYADVRIYAGLNSYERAKHVSDMLSEATIRKQDVGYATDVRDLNVSSREMGRPLMKPDEILAMEKDQAWLFVRGLRPTCLRLINYAQVDPWRAWVNPSPITGTRLEADPVLRIAYSERGPRHGRS
jgi:type IV secretion system protein VirD4